jgi:hypothetical protein
MTVNEIIEEKRQEQDRLRAQREAERRVQVRLLVEAARQIATRQEIAFFASQV